MEEIYRASEEKTRAAGYPGEVDGFAIYEDICNRIEDKEEGAYVLMSKTGEEIWYEYTLLVMEENFNLSAMTIHTPGQDYNIDFDA